MPAPVRGVAAALGVASRIVDDRALPTKPKPDGLDAPIVRKIISTMSRLNVLVYRLTGGLLGSSWRIGAAFPWGVPVLLLTTTGRKSGRRRVAPLIYIEDDERIIIVGSQGGLPKDPLWYRNLQADPQCDVQIGMRRRAMTAQTADADERAALWPRLVAHYADFDNYQAWTDREIPVIVLQPR